MTILLKWPLSRASDILWEFLGCCSLLVGTGVFHHPAVGA